jgi:hypothetical protein
MIGVVAASVLPRPIVTLNATTNFNQNLATLNSSVNGQGLSTSISAEYSSNGGSTWSSPVTMTGSPAYGSVSPYANVTGLSVGTSYIVRITATNAKGSTVVQNSNGNFTTWVLKTYLKTTAGSFSVEVPSVTPTGGSPIAPVIYEMLAYGGGGAAGHGAGGGGGYRLFSSHTSSATGTQNVTGSVGAGGTNPSQVLPAPSGGNTTITVGSTTWTAGGGGGGNNFTSAAGSSGTGDNVSRAGGVGYYGYTYVAEYVFVCTAQDKYGICTDGYTDYNQPIYATDYNRYSGGGGGGTDTAGSNAGYPDYGGAGGNGGGAYGLNGGNGGGGGGTSSTGANGTVVAGGVAVGRGGQGFWGSGTAGGITFKYYGAA